MAPDEEPMLGPATEALAETAQQASGSSKKTKRLTLQERLAAAAKAKRKKDEQNAPKGSDPEAANEVSKPNKAIETKQVQPDGAGDEHGKNSGVLSLLISDHIEGDVHARSGPEKTEETPEVVSENQQNIQNSDSPTQNPESLSQNGLETAEIASSTDATKERTGTPSEIAKDAEIASLKEEIALLSSQLAALKKELSQATRRVPQSKDLDKKLAEKDRLIAQGEQKLQEKENTIQQLMEEGQQLSLKELKLNDRIRLLVATNTKLESSLKSYAEKNEESLLKLGEIEDLVKVHKLQSVDQLFEVLASSNQKITDLQASLDKEKDSNWEGKYKEMQRVYEKELEEKKECKKELSEANVQLELLENQSRLELQSKSDIIDQLNREIMLLKDESSAEVLRLESKIESLRMENENFLKTSQGSSGDDTVRDGAKKLVDYVDFVKLSKTHQSLQSQYVSSQETWKLIESTMQSKIETLNATIETMKKAKQKTSADAKKLHSKLNEQFDQIESLRADMAKFQEEKNDLGFRLQMKQNECSDLEDKLEELRTVFNSDRKNYEVKIKNLSETIQQLELRTPIFTPSMSYDNLSIQGKRGNSAGLHINLDQRPPPFVQRKFSTNSLASSAMNTPRQPWEEQRFVSEGPDTTTYEDHDVSSFSFNEEIYPSEALEPGDALMSINAGMSSSGGVTKNIQIINKMSGSIRRLEAEIQILKEENEQLAMEKETAQQEIVKRLEVDKKLVDLEERIESLHRELEAKDRNQETLLEVIGEKSEKVSELEADVADLKDLLKLQVKQMIEMQGM